MLLDGGIGIEVGVELVGDLVEVEERLAQHRQLSGRAQPAVAGDAGELADHPPGFELAHRHGLVLLDEGDDLALEPGRIPAVAFLAEAGHDRSHLAAVALAQGEEQADQRILQLRADPGHHAQIDQRETAVGGQQHVPRVRVGVDEAVDQDLVEVGVEELGGQGAPVVSLAGERAERADVAAIDQVHRQHERGGVVVDRLGDDDAVVGGEVRAEQAEVGGLEPVVELGHDRAAELLDHAAEPVAAPHLGVTVDELGELLDDLHVLDDLLAHAGPLDLDGDGAAVAQHCPVHLAERGAGHRGVKRLEGLGDAGTDLGGDDLLDRFERDRLDIVLKPGQGVEVDGRQQVGASRQELAQLDERGAHRLELIDELAGVVLSASVIGSGAVRVDLVERVAASVLEQERGDLLVAGEMVNFQRQSHGWMNGYPISCYANP